MFDLINRLLGVTPSAHHKERPPDGDAYWYGPVTPETDSGVEVDEQSAMTFSTVFACVNKLSKTIATLPIHTHEPTGSSGSTVVADHWLTRIWQTAFNFEVLAISGREAEMGNRLLWGNSYNEIVWADRFQSEVDHLIPLLAKWMTVKRSDAGRLIYEYNEPGHKRIIPAENMLHIPGLSFTGIVGLSVIGYQRETVGVSMAARRHGASFFGNSAIPGVVLERPAERRPLSEPAARNLLNQWDEKFMRGGAHKTALLEEGTTARALGMSMEDSQYIEIMQFGRVELCGIFDVPPSKIHDDTRSTFSNVEQKNIDWKVDSIQPHCVRIERALRARFLEGTGLFVKHNMEGLVRGDTKTRAEFHTKMIRVGVTVNEGRAKEDLPGVGPDGDVPLVSQDLAPLSMVVSGQMMKGEAMVNVMQEEHRAETAEASGRHTKELAEERIRTVQVEASAKRERDGREAETRRADALATDRECERSGRIVAEKASAGSRASEREAVQENGKLKVDATRHVLQAEANKASHQRDVAAIHDEYRRAVTNSFAPLFQDAAQRIVTKECKAVGNAWKKYAKANDAGGFDAWFGKFYLEQQETARRIVAPLLLGAAMMVRVDEPEQAAARAARVFAGGYVTLSLAAVRDCIAHDPAGLPNELAEWQEHKAELLAQQLAQLFETKKEKTDEST